MRRLGHDANQRWLAFFIPGIVLVIVAMPINGLARVLITAVAIVFLMAAVIVGGRQRGNSWATGDNPAVDSMYLRLMALNPAVRGHNTNLAVDGTGVDALAGQADQALATTPLPELFLIQSVDNDIRCDGSDPDNYAPFAAALTGVLEKITTGAPKARVLIVSSPPGGQQRHRPLRPVRPRRQARAGPLAHPGGHHPALPR
jgi:hypothetical protein